MAVSSKNITITLLSALVAAIIGYYAGSSQKPKSPPLVNLEEQEKVPEEAAPKGPDNLPQAQVAQRVAGHENWDNKSQDELTLSLSKIMLPDDEYNKLGDAIYQTAANLLMSQAQSSGVEVTEATQLELKDSINKKYSRQYFADINASSMKELSKPELVSILSFYSTEAGQKFLTLSPKIIEATMASVQQDLSQWLPSTVDAMLTKLKGGAPNKAPQDDRRNSRLNNAHDEALFRDKAELDS
jgi:hypothetical protein